ncbi:MAG: PorT family protein [Bacteroidetes bacterium]|nr:PorT family protein [Bacteroidota bacterium]
MKKYLFLLIFLLVTSLNAQFIRGYGLKAGFTSSNLKWDYNTGGQQWMIEPDNRNGVNLGLFVEFLDLPVFSTLAEVNYVQKGINQNVPFTSPTNPDGGEESLNWQINLDYLNLSFLAKGRISIGQFTPYLLAGPSYDIEINRSVENDDIDNYKDYKKHRMGLKLGAGTEFKLETVTLLAEFVYQADPDNLFNNQLLIVTTSSFDLRIGVFFQ